MTWIVAVKRPFYPSVEAFDTREEAEAEAKEWLHWNAEADGDNAACVYIAEVASVTPCKTYY